jgi:hypothetical protein
VKKPKKEEVLLLAAGILFSIAAWGKDDANLTGPGWMFIVIAFCKYAMRDSEKP